jgi:hypothetical protein
MLDLTGLSEEGPIVATVLKVLGSIIRCMVCKGWIVMDIDTAASSCPDCSTSPD